jgi:exonuclease VII small subunit
MPYQWKTPLEKVQVDSYKALCERLEAIVEQLEKLNSCLERSTGQR